MSLFKKDKKYIDEEEASKRTISFFNWIQEFSKKIITITFYIFVIINIYVLVIIWLAYNNSGDTLYLDTLISETHLTFREVIGGYFIKAATENALKIAGSIIESFLKYKLKKEYNITVSDEEDNTVDESIDDPDFIEEENREIEEDYPEDELAAAYKEE